MELDDCGMEMHLNFSGIYVSYSTDVEVIMSIKTQDGIMLLFKGEDTTSQCEAIRTFMEEHGGLCKSTD